jgi:hypothetical protein
MISKIELFLFVLSIVFILRFVLEFVIKLFITDAQPITITKYDKVFLYFAFSYIITYILI